jgi:hypothetical protein
MYHKLFLRLFFILSSASLFSLAGFAANTTGSKSSSPSVTGFVLINAATQQVVGPLGSGATIDLSQVGTALNIRADVQGTVGSVTFSLDGVVFSRENLAPYALAGGNGASFNAWRPSVGPHTLRAVPTTRANGSGQSGTALQITFNVISGAAINPPSSTPPPPPPPLVVTGFVLVNASTQQDIRALAPGDTIDLAKEGSSLNIRAEFSGAVASMTFTLDGATARLENGAPYSLAGETSGTYNSWTPTVGSHTLNATPFAIASGGGSPGTPLAISFSVISSPPPAPTSSLAVTKLTLIDTVTQQDIRALTSGDGIDLFTEGSSLNVRADGTSSIACVVFILDGVTFGVENVAPFALAADSNGKYNRWTPAVGKHTLRAVPYPKANATGTPGDALEVAFTVTSTPPTITSATTFSDPELVKPLPLYDSTGKLNVSLYNILALSYDKATMEMRLGPSFLDFNDGSADTRPTLFQQTSKAYSSGYIRVNPYQLGTPVKDNDYWSDSGQVGYVPDVTSDPGLDRVQMYAYYDHVFALSPRLDWACSKPHPEPQTLDSYYGTLFGELPKYPVAMERNYGMQQNEALVLYRDGYLGVAGTQTSRTPSERPYPGLVFPANKVPTSIAVTTSNEFALVTIWDITAQKGQLAVIALEGKYLPFHTWPYMGMPNQGSWSAFKLLGYVDLPMTMPTSVAASSNAWWSGPSQTNGLVLSQIDLSNDSYRKNVYSGAWSAVVAKGGYAIVASKYDNKAVIVDLAPLFTYMRESYLSSSTSYQATIASRGAGDGDFPQVFSVRPSITPKVVWQQTIAQPTCVLAGLKIDRWSRDFHKAYVASADGTIHIIDASSLMYRKSWEQKHALAEIGSFNVGRNPTSMCFTRRKDSNLPLLPMAADGTQYDPDPLNNLFYVAVRGERKVVASVTFGKAGAVYRTIQDTRMNDPVYVSTAVRGPILSVADFRGRKILSFRMGTINDSRNGMSYGSGPDGKDAFEFAGELPFNGYPFLVNSSNVN